MKAWHFLHEDRRLAFPQADGSQPIVEVGRTLTESRPLKLCQVGLHASVRAIDALYYAPGPIVCRVECEGEVIEGDDKLVCSKRTVLWMTDATRALYLFACDEAERALALVGNPDPRSVAAIAAKRAWLDGKIADAELAAARDAAESAASAAAHWAAYAAWSAASTAASTAARAAARSAAESAAWSAARSAAESAAWSAAYYAADTADTTRSAAYYVADAAAAARSAARDAAWDAAWYAAWAAAESAARAAYRAEQNSRLEAALEALNAIQPENQ